MRFIHSMIHIRWLYKCISFLYKCKKFDGRSKLINITFCINKCNITKEKYGVESIHELECTLYETLFAVASRLIYFGNFTNTVNIVIFTLTGQLKHPSWRYLYCYFAIKSFLSESLYLCFHTDCCADAINIRHKKRFI